MPLCYDRLVCTVQDTSARQPATKKDCGSGEPSSPTAQPSTINLHPIYHTSILTSPSDTTRCPLDTRSLLVPHVILRHVLDGQTAAD